MVMKKSFHSRYVTQGRAYISQAFSGFIIGMFGGVIIYSMLGLVLLASGLSNGRSFSFLGFSVVSSPDGATFIGFDLKFIMAIAVVSALLGAGLGLLYTKRRWDRESR